MSDTVKFILEVGVISLLIALAIKAIGPALPIPATDLNALAIVLTPTLIMGGLLAWRRLR